MHNETYEVASLFQFSIERIEFYWNFYVVSILVIAGWLTTAKARHDRTVCTLLISGYVCLAGMNLLGLYGSYLATEALRLDLIAVAAKEKAALDSTSTVFSSVSYEHRWILAAVVHLVVGALMIRTIWSRFGKVRDVSPVAKESD